MQTTYKIDERGFTKYNPEAETQKNLMIHHVARLYMMTQEEKGIIVSYKEAIDATNH